MCSGPSPSRLPTHCLPVAPRLPPVATHPGAPAVAASSWPAAEPGLRWTSGARPPGPASAVAPLPPGLPEVGIGKGGTGDSGQRLSAELPLPPWPRDPPITAYPPEPTVPWFQNRDGLSTRSRRLTEICWARSLSTARGPSSCCTVKAGMPGCGQARKGETRAARGSPLSPLPQAWV